LIQLLTGKVALVTGGGRGFGTGIARGLAQAGAAVAITDIVAEELGLAAEEILADGGRVLPVVADAGDFAQMSEAVQQVVAQWGRLDALVNNAGHIHFVPFSETSPAIWKNTLNVNLTGVYNGVRAVWEQMIEQGGGHCVTIASGASVRGFVDEVAYCAAKHGVEGLTKALAMEGEPFNIAVNTMGPGKRIKPTGITRAEAASRSQEEQATWVDPLLLAPAFVWLLRQKPSRFTGLRFDAGPVADAVAAEGYDFEFAPSKVTLYVEEFIQRLEQRKDWTTLT
jgi:NAD(P)-dependent dehydrogenase (short-subunit alcohol dehydrogenase family)